MPHIFGFVGPSGVGKTTIINQLKQKYGADSFVTCTTRTPRQGEIDGVHYHFLSEDEFKEKVEQGEFIEYSMYSGSFYGTLKKTLTTEFKNNVYLALDSSGISAYKSFLGPEFISIGMVPHLCDLRSRLVRRGDPHDTIEKRLSKVPFEISSIKKLIKNKELDYLVKVSDLDSKETTFQQFDTIVYSCLFKASLEDLADVDYDVK